MVLIFLWNILVFFALIAFFITNGISCNLPLVLGILDPLLTSTIINRIVEDIYHKHGKEFNISTMVQLLFDFDQECEDFLENYRPKLNRLRNRLF